MTTDMKAHALTPRQENAIRDVLREVEIERRQQHKKWGEQNHRDIDHVTSAAFLDGELAKLAVESASKIGKLSFGAILYEELCEAVDEAKKGDDAKLRTELVQCAAVVVAWIEAIDRRNPTAARPPLPPMPEHPLPTHGTFGPRDEVTEVPPGELRRCACGAHAVGSITCSYCGGTERTKTDAALDAIDARFAELNAELAAEKKKNADLDADYGALVKSTGTLSAERDGALARVIELEKRDEQWAARLKTAEEQNAAAARFEANMVVALDDTVRDLERERMRLAACGVVAVANTPESAKRARSFPKQYNSAAVEDVARIVDSEMALRSQLKRYDALAITIGAGRLVFTIICAVALLKFVGCV